MPLLRLRIRTLIIAVAATALYMAGLVAGPVWLVIALVLFAMIAPVVFGLIYLVSKVSRNTLV